MAIQLCNYSKKMLFLLTLINVCLTKMVMCTMNSGIDADTYKTFGDTPRQDDLNTYLGSLEKVIDFSLRYKHHVDLNFQFGLFLVTVHLKPILTSKRDKLPVHVYNRLGKLLFKNDKLTHYFHYMVNNMPTHLKMLLEDAAKITSLFSNATLWSERMPKLTLDLLKKTKRRTRTELRMIYSKPKAYEEHVFDFQNGFPTPQLSDKCMSYLADNVVYDGFRAPKCQLPDICKNMLRQSTDLGYFICHRLLHFLAAHLGRGCVVFSEEEDREVMQDMCAMISDESQYIAMNNFTVKDLLLEEVALCSLSGNAQFLQRAWISEVLRYQTDLGCFGNDIGDPIKPKADKTQQWKLVSIDNNDIFGGYCNTHLAAVATGTIAAALRFVLENYY